MSDRFIAIMRLHKDVPLENKLVLFIAKYDLRSVILLLVKLPSLNMLHVEQSCLYN